MNSGEARQRIKICSASGGSPSKFRQTLCVSDSEGIHTTSIPQWIIANIVNRELCGIKYDAYDQST